MLSAADCLKTDSQRDSHWRVGRSRAVTDCLASLTVLHTRWLSSVQITIKRYATVIMIVAKRQSVSRCSDCRVAVNAARCVVVMLCYVIVLSTARYNRQTRQATGERDNCSCKVGELLGQTLTPLATGSVCKWAHKSRVYGITSRI